jgi:Fe-S cluster assembly protein SufD
LADTPAPGAPGTSAGSSDSATITVNQPAEGPGSGPRGAADARLAPVLSRDPGDFKTPEPRDEEWRFTPLERLRGLLTGEPAAEGAVTVAVDAPEGVEVSEVGLDDPRVGSVLTPGDIVAAHGVTSAGGATVVRVPRGLQAAAPVTVSVTGKSGPDSTAYGHLVVDVEEAASAVVVIDHTGSAAWSSSVELRVGQAASLTLVTLQDWDDDAVHSGSHAALVGRDARFRGVTVTLGGDLVRLKPTVRYGGPGGEAELLGLYFADAGQHLEHRVVVDHDHSSCRSRVTYKGALQGDGAHSVWFGDVIIRPDTTGTDTYELNRNLLLTEGARADSVPNLEIETGEVAGAGHASATGRFDDEQLFYLQSRGIPADRARRLVVRGFFADVVQQIGMPDLESRLTEAIDAELEKSLT